MRYQKINKNLLNLSEKSTSLKVDEKALFTYLLNNNVAYYYILSKTRKRSPLEKEILNKGKKFNEEFRKTLRFIHMLCAKYKIDYALFKTRKYTEEGIDGDIDLVVKKRDFYKFLQLLKEDGFDCFEEGPLKGICIKNGYKKIEPRSQISFHGMTVFSEEEIWKHVEKIEIGGIKTFSTSQVFDVVCLLLNVLYGPKYISLYLYMIYKQINFIEIKNLLNSSYLISDLALLDHMMLAPGLMRKKFPLFLSNGTFIKFWFNRILLNDHFTTYNKIKYFIFFFYSKYKYLIFNNLNFEHEWIGQ